MALKFNVIVPFREVFFEDIDWEVSATPDCAGFLTYTSLDSSASITITRADGEVLDFDAPTGYQVQIAENVIRFHAQGDSQQDFRRLQP